MAIAASLIGFNNATSGGTTLAATVPAGGVAVGQRVLVEFSSNNASTDAQPTCADSKGNVYVVDEESVLGAIRTIVFSAPVTTALVLNDTITVTCPSTGRREITAHQANVGAMSVSTKGTGTSSSPSSGPTPPRPVAESLILGACGWRFTATGDVFTPGTGFGNVVTVEAGAVTTWRYLATEYRIVTVVGTDAATGTLNSSREWGMIAVVYPAIAEAPASGVVTHVASATLPLGTETTGGTITIPAGTQEWDELEVLVISRNHHSGLAFVTCTDTDTGGELWVRRSVTGSRRGYLFRKKATAGTAGKTITIAGAVDSCAAGLSVYRGAWRGGDPTEAPTNELQLGADPKLHAGIIPLDANAMICAAVFNHTSDVAVTLMACTTPGALTTRFERLSTGGLRCGVHHASAPQIGGPVATGDVTWAQTNNSNYSMVWTIRPEPIVAPPPEQASARCKAVAFNIGAGLAGSTLAVTGVGFQPKAVQFFAIGRTEAIDAGGQGIARRLLGFAADCAGVLKNRCGANLSEHNKATGFFSAYRMGRSDACLQSLTTAGADGGRARVTSFTADGCVLTIDTQFGTDLRIIALCYGGTDITDCAIGTFTPPTAGTLPVSQDVTGLGFTCTSGAAVGFFLGADLSIDNAGAAEATLGLGAFVQPNDGARWSGETDNAAQAATRTRRHCSRARPWGSITTDGMTKRIAFTGWIADGFRLAHDETSASAELIYYLVIKGGRWALADGFTSTQTAPVVLSGLGIGRPVGGFLVSALASTETPDDIANTTDASCFGVFTAPTNRFAVAQRDQHTVDPSSVATRIEHDQMYASLDTLGALTGAMDLQSFDADGVTFSQDVIEVDSDTAAAVRRFFWCVLFGRAAGFVGDPSVGHKHWRFTLLNEAGTGPPVNQLEVVARRGKAAAPGSTMTNPARLHPGITHISPAMILNGGVVGSLNGEADADIAMMTLPAGYVPGLPTDQARRQLDTLFDSDGILLPTVRQNDGTGAQPLVKGTIRGIARDTDEISFATFGRAFQTIPKVSIRGGILNHPGTVWQPTTEPPPAAVPPDATKPQYEDFGAVNLNRTGFLCRARLRQKASFIGLQGLGFNGQPLSEVDEMDIVALLSNAPSNDDRYHVKVLGQAELKSQNGAPYSAILTYVVETSGDAGATWAIRSSGSFVFETTSRILVTKATSLTHTLTVAFTIPANDGSDRIRIRLFSIEEEGLGSFVVGNTWIRGVSSATWPNAGINFTHSTDLFTSKTPSSNDFVEWEATGYV